MMAGHFRFNAFWVLGVSVCVLNQAKLYYPVHDGRRVAINHAFKRLIHFGENQYGE